METEAFSPLAGRCVRGFFAAFMRAAQRVSSKLALIARNSAYKNLLNLCQRRVLVERGKINEFLLRYYIETRLGHTEAYEVHEESSYTGKDR